MVDGGIHLRVSAEILEFDQTRLGRFSGPPTSAALVELFIASSNAVRIAAT
jgi:hypothetical protein